MNIDSLIGNVALALGAISTLVLIYKGISELRSKRIAETAESQLAEEKKLKAKFDNAVENRRLDVEIQDQIKEQVKETLESNSVEIRELRQMLGVQQKIQLALQEDLGNVRELLDVERQARRRQGRIFAAYVERVQTGGDSQLTATERAILEDVIV